MNLTTEELKKLQAQITQGEWNRGLNGFGQNILIVANVRETPVTVAIASSVKNITYIGKHEQEANAQAMALVPGMIAKILELKEALQEILERAEMTYPHFEQTNGQATIKKARSALGEK